MTTPPAFPDVVDLLPHRFPFLLVDRITALEAGHRAEGIKRVTAGDWFVGESGALPDRPSAPGMPNGLVVEALAQLSAAVLVGLVDANGGVVGYFLGLERVRYRGTARAGDDLRLVVELRQFRRGLCRLHGEAWVRDHRIVRADLTIVVRAAV